MANQALPPRYRIACDWPATDCRKPPNGPGKSSCGLENAITHEATVAARPQRGDHPACTARIAAKTLQGVLAYDLIRMYECKTSGNGSFILRVVVDGSCRDTCSTCFRRGRCVGLSLTNGKEGEELHASQAYLFDGGGRCGGGPGWCRPRIRPGRGRVRRRTRPSSAIPSSIRRATRFSRPVRRLRCGKTSRMPAQRKR